MTARMLSAAVVALRRARGGRLRRRSRYEGRNRQRWRGRREALARRLLDPAGGLRGADPGVPHDGRRQGREVQRSPTAPRATRAARSQAGLPADVVAFSLAPDITRLVDAGMVDAELGRATPHKGIVTNSVVVVRRPQGQPEEHQDLGRPASSRASQVITPNPFTSGGARWNIMAAYGAQLEQGKSPAAGARIPQGAVPRRAGAGQVGARRAADVHRRQGRRAARLRERGDHRPAEGRGRSTTSIPDQTILIENPVAVTTKAQERRAGEGVRGLPVHAGGAEDLRRARATARSIPSARRQASKFPTPEGAVHDRRSSAAGTR